MKSPKPMPRSIAKPYLLAAVIIALLCLQMTGCTERKRRKCVRACAAQTRALRAKCATLGKEAREKCQQQETPLSLQCLNRCL